MYAWGTSSARSNPAMMNVLLIDNHDSFTYNLYHLIAEITGSHPLVIKHDDMSYQDIESMGFDGIVISPGPGHPARNKDFGVCEQILQNSTSPVLGICLGHQGLCTAFGGQV